MQQHVRQLRVGRQQWPVDVRPQHRSLHRALGSIRAVVPAPHRHRRQGNTARTERGPASVILEPHQLEFVPPQGGSSPDPADDPVPAGPRGHVQESEALDLRSVGGDVGPAHELVAAAHAEQHRAASDHFFQLASSLLEVRGQRLLHAVRAAADQDQVGASGQTFASGHSDDVHGEAPPLGPALERQDVAAVAVGP